MVKLAGRMMNKNDEQIRKKTRMWANAKQRDGRPVEYRWRRLFNAAVWLTPTIPEWRAVMLRRRESR